PYLENWDYRYDMNSTAASVFDTFFITLTRNTLSGLVGEEIYQNLIRVENIPIRIMKRLLQENSFLFQEVGANGIDSRDEIIRLSMQESIEWLSEQYGDEPVQWRWENLHTLTLRPALFAEASDDPDAPAVLKMIVNNLMSKGPYPVPGQGTTVNKAQYDWSNPYQMLLGPSIRRIVDFGNLNRIETVTPTGQSGNPLSEYFGDQTELWLQGQYRYLYQDSTFFREVSYQTMRLEPAH
ncbi:MAG: penicillin acylase family protein, partial [Balneolaceae bacterium]